MQELSEAYCARYGSADLFHSAVCILLETDVRAQLHPDFFRKLRSGLHDLLRPEHYHVIGAEKRTGLFVLHFFRKASFTGQALPSVSAALRKLIGPGIDYYIAAGQVVSGIRNLYDSYSTADTALQRCFFHQPGAVIMAPSLTDPDGMRNSFSENTLFPDEAEKCVLTINAAVKNADRDAMAPARDALYSILAANDRSNRRTAMVRYLSMMAVIRDQYLDRQLSSAPGFRELGEAAESMEHCFSFDELHKTLSDTLGSYFDAAEKHVPENPSVYLIKSYISSHYGSTSLSTKELSEHVALSPSYICTIFRAETGKTLNQYITEYRMEKARELLADPLNNIADVAYRTGYSDSNYFSKAFKKYTGFSPSEFREGKNLTSWQSSRCGDSPSEFREGEHLTSRQGSRHSGSSSEFREGEHLTSRQGSRCSDSPSGLREGESR